MGDQDDDIDIASSLAGRLYGHRPYDERDQLDMPTYDTSALTDRMQRYEQIPPWMKAVEPYDASLSHWLQASPWGGYPEALEGRDLAYGPLGTVPWMAAGAAKALAAKPAFDVGKNAVREQLWDRALAKGMAFGGEVPPMPPAATQALHEGPLHSRDGGRTDVLPVDVESGAYIIPADTVSALGENNTEAGQARLDDIFGSIPESPMPRASGGGVPIIAAGGEYAVSPAKVAAIGGGDITQGHRILDQFVLKIRKQHIDQLKKLPPPAT